MVKEQVPDASYSALKVFISCGLVLVVQGYEGIVLGCQGKSAKAQHTVNQRMLTGRMLTLAGVSGVCQSGK
jgi:hypothetical protein